MPETTGNGSTRSDRGEYALLLRKRDSAGSDWRKSATVGAVAVLPGARNGQNGVDKRSDREQNVTCERLPSRWYNDLQSPKRIEERSLASPAPKVIPLVKSQPELE